MQKQSGIRDVFAWIKVHFNVRAILHKRDLKSALGLMAQFLYDCNGAETCLLASACLA